MNEGKIKIIETGEFIDPITARVTVLEEKIAELEAARKPTVEGRETMNEKLVNRLAYEVGSDIHIPFVTVKEIVSKTLSLLEADRNPTIEGNGETINLLSYEFTPDSITIPEAVAALVEYFENFNVCIVSTGGCWKVYIDKWMDDPVPDWANAILNGRHSTAAVKVGLEDLFTTILMDAKEAGK